MLAMNNTEPGQTQQAMQVLTAPEKRSVTFLY